MVASAYWNYNSCKDKLSVQLGSSTHFHDQSLAGNIHPWAAWPGSPSKPGRQTLFFFFSCKNSVEVWMKQSQVTEQLQSSFPWSSLWRLCGPSSTPVTPAGLKAAISSTCLYFCSYKSLNFGPPCLSSLGRLCFFGPGFIILSVIPKL